MASCWFWRPVSINYTIMNVRQPDVVTVAVKQAGGGLTILRVVENEYAPNPENPTERILSRHLDVTPEYVDSIIAKHVAGGNWIGDKAPVGWRIVPNDFVDESTDRIFRNSWKDTGKKKPEVDMPKAREIHKDNMRKARFQLLEDLDTAYMLADEQGDAKKKKDIAAQKQALRDVTAHPDIEKAKTPEQLKAIWPEILS